MSKSFTPKELHHVNKKFNFSQLTLSNETTQQIIYNAKSEFSKNYPHISFLISNSETLLKEVSPVILCEIETIIDNIITAEDNDTVFVPQNTDEKTLLKWFNGELDPHFYYDDYNNKLIIDFILNKKE